MRFVTFILSIIIIIILLFLVGFLLPSKVTLSKSVLINAPGAKVNEQVQDFNNWKNWYPAFQNEKFIVLNSQPVAGALRAVSLTEAGSAKLRVDLMEAKKDTTVVLVESNSPTLVNYQFVLKNNNNEQTQLIWNVNVDLGYYPWQRIKGIFLDKMNGPQYEAALANLKAVVEK